MGDYKITFYGHRTPKPATYTKSRFVNAKNWVERLMMGLEPGEKIVIERTG